MRLLVADRGTGEPISFGAAVLAGKKPPPDVTGLLMEDHRVVLGWFDWYEQAIDELTKAAVAQRICLALRAHMAGEEEVLYPAAESIDPELARAAYEEHEDARRLMERIETATDIDADHETLMSDLRAEIERHVESEETELFPRLREGGIDLYAVGGALATRRAQYLLDHVPSPGSVSQEMVGLSPEESPAMTVSAEHAREYYVLGLKNAHATVKDGRTMVEAQVDRLEQYPKLKARLTQHLEEKDAQLARIEELLERCGESPSTLKDIAAKVMGGIGTLTSAAASDEIIKNSFATLGLAKFEAAAFETLILFAEAAGEYDAMRPLQQCLSEERSMAAFIEENLRPTGLRFLQLKSEDRQASH